MHITTSAVPLVLATDCSPSQTCNNPAAIKGMLLLLLLPLCSAQLCSHPCDLSAASPLCNITNQLLLCNSSVVFYAQNSLEFDNVTVYCYISPTSEDLCVIQLLAPAIVLVNSFLLGSSVEVNSTDALFSNSTLSANGTAPYAPIKACLDKAGGYGGRGGGSCRFTCSDTSYGSPFWPVDYGSPGQGLISSGGGRVIIEASNLGLSGGEVSASGNLPLNNQYVGTTGVMSVASAVAGGSGGSILILTDSYTADGDLVVTAAGGTGGALSYGGGGGRVAIYGSGPTVRVIISGGFANDNTRICVLGGAGTFYEDSSNTLLVDNNGVRTNNVTPLPANATIKLQVLNGAEVSPDFVENSLNFASISVVNALIVEAVDRLHGITPNFLNVSSPVIQLTNEGSIGAFDETWIVINTENMTIDTSSGLFFGGLLNISAFYLVLNGAIVGNVQTPILTTILIYSQHVDILSEGVLNADLMGFIVDGGTFYLQGDMESPGSTCTNPSILNSSSVYQCLDLDTLGFRMPNVTELLQGNFTIFILATQSLEIIDSGKILGSRIGLCSLEVLIEGTVASTGFGCMSGNGAGKGGYLVGECQGSGGGYGGSGGTGMYANGTVCAANPGGKPYGLPNETWYEGSGGGSSEAIGGAGGGFIAISGLYSIDIAQGKVMANGEDSPPSSEAEGAGGGAGGSIWLTTQFLTGHLARIWSVGGDGAGLGAGGGGGRILFQWIGVQGPDSGYQYNHKNCSDDWQQSNVSVQGGVSSHHYSSQQSGDFGSITSLQCTPGYFGPLCLPCDIGYYKAGWDYAAACLECSNKPAPGTYTHDHWSTSDCPYRCPSTYADASENPHCYSPLEVFVNYFGGPGGAIGVFLGSVATLTALGFLAHAYTVKFVLKRTVPKPVKPSLRSSSPSLSTFTRKTMSSASAELTREDLPFHHKRCYLLGDNSYACPWSLPLIPTSSIEDDVRAEEFANFADQVNTLMRWPWWQHAVLKVLLVLHHPVGYLWLLYQRRRRYKSLLTFVQGYEEVLWKRVDLRELGNSLKVSASHCYTNAALDFMNPVKKIEEWDERPELPLSIFCNGDGSFFCPHRLDSSDLMVQFLAYSLDMDHLEQYYEFIDEFNTISRTFSFSSAPPDTSQPEMRSLITVAKRYNQQIFNERGFEVVPCLFQSLLTVLSGRYIFTSYSYSFTNDVFNAGAQHVSYADTTKRYCYKVGLIVTALDMKFQDSEVTTPVKAKDAQHWQPLALDAEMEAVLVNNGLSLARLPVTPHRSSCRLGSLLSKQARGRQCIVLAGLLVCMFTDLVASAVTVIGLASEQYWSGVVVFVLVVPFASTAGQILGWVMLFRPAYIRSFISFELASLLNVFSTLLFCVSVKDYFVWSLFLVVDFLVKVAVVRLAAMHLAHAETYLMPSTYKQQSGMGAELLGSVSFDTPN